MLFDQQLGRRHERGLRAARGGGEAGVESDHGLAEGRYNSGVGGYLAVLEAQRAATIAQSRLLETQRQRLEARIDLYLALGGGWADAAQETAPPVKDLS